MTKSLLFLTALVALASCHKSEPAAPTAEQSARLNEAENMLDSQFPASKNGNEKGPAANATGPSDRSK